MRGLNLSAVRPQSQSHIATNGQSISKSWCRALSGAHDQIFITLWQLRFCFCGELSLTRGRVCLLYMLLASSSVVFLGSEFIRTRDKILLSQIWDFPFRHLLRLAGSRWRYSTPPPHRCSVGSSYITPVRTEQRTPLPRITPLLNYMLSGLLPNDGPGIVDAKACLGCFGNVFKGRWIEMDKLSGPFIPAFSHHVTVN
jgi:hypothetical protein